MAHHVEDVAQHAQDGIRVVVIKHAPQGKALTNALKPDSKTLTDAATDTSTEQLSHQQWEDQQRNGSFEPCLKREHRTPAIGSARSTASTDIDPASFGTSLGLSAPISLLVSRASDEDFVWEHTFSTNTASAFSATQGPQSTFRWKWADAKRNPFSWSRARGAEETVEELLRQVKSSCVNGGRQVKLEIRGSAQCEVALFTSVFAVIAYLNDMAPASDPLSLGQPSSFGLAGPDDLLWNHTPPVESRRSTATPPSWESTVPTTMRWMWGDAGPRVCQGKRLAKENPFRWSGAQSLQTTVMQLQTYRFKKAACARPVRMEIRRQEKSKVVISHMMYTTLLAALHDLVHLAGPTEGAVSEICGGAHKELESPFR